MLFVSVPCQIIAAGTSSLQDLLSSTERPWEKRPSVGLIDSYLSANRNFRTQRLAKGLSLTRPPKRTSPSFYSVHCQTLFIDHEHGHWRAPSARTATAGLFAKRKKKSLCCHWNPVISKSVSRNSCNIQHGDISMLATAAAPQKCNMALGLPVLKAAGRSWESMQ